MLWDICEFLSYGTFARIPNNQTLTVNDSFAPFLKIELIEHYDGSIDKLGEAEKFYHYLIHLSNFQFRIEAMILKGDFNAQLGAIRPNLQVLHTLCRRLFDNHSLKTFLRYVLHTGNFLNKVGFFHFITQLQEIP